MTKKERKRKKKLQTYNRKLIEKYPWLLPRSAWTGKPLEDYDYTYIEWGWSEGWDRAFGKMFMEELGEAIKEAGLEHSYRILQIKEKFARACLYDNGGTQKMYDIIRKYEIISEACCWNCGKPAPITDTGWLTPYCEKCFKEYYRRREKWQMEHIEDYQPHTDEELTELYKKCCCSIPEADGKYHYPLSYTVHYGGNKVDKVVDISKTARALERRMCRED